MAGLAGVAHAGSGTGYVCYSEDYVSGGPSWGSYGAVYVNVSTGPSCTGNFVGGGYFCSSGANNASCSPYGIHGDTGLYSLADRLQRAAAANQKVYLQVDGNGNPWRIDFYAGGF
jgi:hypothetical protein